MDHPMEDQESAELHHPVLWETPNLYKQRLLGAPPLWGSEEAALRVCLTFSPPLDLLSTKPQQLVGHFEPEPRRPGSVALKALFRKILAHVCTQ